MIKHLILKIYAKTFIAVHKAGCHQRADRSFFCKGYQFPMCARCMGVMIGYLTAAPIYFRKRFSFWLYIILCAIMFIDWYIQYLKIKESTNLRRLITGILGGFGLMSLEIAALKFIIMFLKVHL